MFITHCDSRAISKSTIPECCGSKPGLCSEIWDYKVFHISIQQLQNLWWNSDPLMYPFFVADAVSAPSSEHEPLWLSFHHFSFPVSLPHPLWPLFKQKKKKCYKYMTQSKCSSAFSNAPACLFAASFFSHWTISSSVTSSLATLLNSKTSISCSFGNRSCTHS